MHTASILYVLNRVIFQTVKIYCIQSGSFTRTADSTRGSKIGMIVLFDWKTPPIWLTNTFNYSLYQKQTFLLEYFRFVFCFCDFSEKFEEKRTKKYAVEIDKKNFNNYVLKIAINLKINKKNRTRNV